MTQAEIKLCSLLLQEHFGEIVEKIGTYLVRTGGQPLRAIVSDTGTSLDQVRPGLRQLASRRPHAQGSRLCSGDLRTARQFPSPEGFPTSKIYVRDTNWRKGGADLKADFFLKLG